MKTQFEPGALLKHDGGERGVVILKVLHRSTCVEGYYCEIVQHPTKKVGSCAHYRDELLVDTQLVEAA